MKKCTGHTGLQMYLLSYRLRSRLMCEHICLPWSTLESFFFLLVAKQDDKKFDEKNQHGNQRLWSID